MKWGFNFGFSGPSASLEPIGQLPPPSYISAILERQKYPVAISGALSYLLLGDSTVDLVGGATHTAANGALVAQSVDETTRLNLQSKLVTGRFLFPATNSRLDADSSSTLQVGPASALLAWLVRYPVLPTADRFVVSKREQPGPNTGYEIGLKSTGELFANTDNGPDAPVTLQLQEDETRNQTGGTWRCEVWYRDASRNIIQLGTDRELGGQVSFSGDLTTTQPFSLGAGRLTGVPGAEIVMVAGWVGSPLDGLFGDGAGGRAADGLPNITENVAIPLFLDMAGAQTVSPLP